jgi:hypothetical protein
MTMSRRLRDDAPAAMLLMHYGNGAVGQTVWLDPAEAEKLAARLRKKGHNIEIVRREGAKP